MRVLCIIVLVLSFLSQGKFAQGDEATAQRKALLLLKALSSDKNLSAKIKKTGGKATVAIVFADASDESKTEKAEMEQAFKTLEKTTTVAGMPIQTSSIAFISNQDFSDKIAALKPVLLYVCTALGDKIANITLITRAGSILSTSGIEQYIYGGISIGVIIVNEKPKYLVNLAASKSEGADFPVSFLRFVEMIAK